MADPINLKPTAIDLHRKVDSAAADKKLHEVAEMYEEQFLREMVKAMRGTVQDGGLIKVSQGEQIYREQLDQNYVENWGKQGGLGFQKIIYDQLMDKFGAKMGLKTQEHMPRGPVKLDEKSNLNSPFQVKAQQAVNPKNINFEFLKSMKTAEAQEIKAPWSGEILGSHQINPNEYVVEMSHENGLKSQIVFRGSLAQKGLEPGDYSPRSVQAGETIGLLSPEAQRFFWSVGPSDRNQTTTE